MPLSFEIDYFPNGRPVLDEYNIGTQMIYDYGHGMDETEFEDFKNIYEEKLKEVDQWPALSKKEIICVSENRIISKVIDTNDINFIIFHSST